MKKDDFLEDLKKLSIEQINKFIENKGKVKLIPLFIKSNHILNEEE